MFMNFQKHSQGFRHDADLNDVTWQKLSEAKRALHESTFLGSLAGPARKFKDYAGFRIEQRR